MDWPQEFVSLAGSREITLKWSIAGDSSGVVAAIRVTDLSGKSRLDKTVSAGEGQTVIDVGQMVDSSDEGWIVSLDLVSRQTEVFPGSVHPPWIIEWHGARVARFQR
jgi:hypothetical protein